MRQFKFRGYDKVNKRMFEVYGLGQDWVTENTFDGVCEGQNCWTDELFFNDIEVMQFIRISKTNKEVYEGDIVVCNGQNCVVVFGSKTLGFGYHVKYNTAWQTIDKFYRLTSKDEPIGNIYESPQLLTR